MTTAPVRISNALKKEFEKLQHKSNWDPVGWPAFVREAVREKLTQEQRLDSFRVEAPAKDDPS